ncbi:MAG: thiolase family protein [Hyphomicrobiaceae bacterium]|nr:MAG: thiolase family protein [Hyphomicrobiaceae bacterium]
MARHLSSLRPVYVVGVGWHRYQPPSETPYVALGLKAVRDALADARLEWPAVESTYVATARLGMACGRPMLRHLGALGRPLVHIENASASGSAAFRLACTEVAAGLSDVVLAVGVDKVSDRLRASSQIGLQSLTGSAIVPATHYALLMSEYAQRHKVRPEDIALVAVKNHRNGARNENAQRRKERTLEEVLGGKRVSGTLTSLQCTPIGEGAAAVIVASEDGVKRYGIDASRTIRVVASAANSEMVGHDENRDAAITQAAMAAAFAEAQIAPSDLDVVELHDAFTIEEIEYAEATGICQPGRFIPMLEEGAFDIGGKCAISPSGGLIAMGHPIGPTGLGQIGEITLQLRGEAGARQQPHARTGLAHMVGVGAVCYVHILQRV